MRVLGFMLPPMSGKSVGLLGCKCRPPPPKGPGCTGWWLGEKEPRTSSGLSELMEVH